MTFSILLRAVFEMSQRPHRTCGSNWLHNTNKSLPTNLCKSWTFKTQLWNLRKGRFALIERNVRIQWMITICHKRWLPWNKMKSNRNFKISKTQNIFINAQIKAFFDEPKWNIRSKTFLNFMRRRVRSTFFFSAMQKSCIFGKAKINVRCIARIKLIYSW